MVGWCLLLGLSCLIAWSLWVSVKLKERLPDGHWFRSSSTVAVLPHSLHGFFQFPLSLCCLLTFPLLQSFHLLQAQVAPWRVVEKKAKRKKLDWTQKVLNRLTTEGWGGGLGCDWTPLCCRNAHREGKKMGWLGNNYRFKERGKKKQK